MSIFETSLALIVFTSILLSLFKPNVNIRIIRTLALVGLLLMLVHILVDTPRWPMLPFYVVGIISPFATLLRTHAIVKKLACSTAFGILIIGGIWGNTASTYSLYQGGKQASQWVYLNAFGHSVEFSDDQQPTNVLLGGTHVSHEAKQPIMVFSNADYTTVGDYKKLITKLLDKGYKVMSFGPPCDAHDEQMSGVIIEKTTPEIKSVVDHELELSPKSDFRYASYNPEEVLY